MEFTDLLIVRARQIELGNRYARKNAREQLTAVRPYLRKMSALQVLISAALDGCMTRKHIKNVYAFEDGVRWACEVSRNLK